MLPVTESSCGVTIQQIEGKHTEEAWRGRRGSHRNKHTVVSGRTGRLCCKSMADNADRTSEIGHSGTSRGQNVLGRCPNIFRSPFCTTLVLSGPIPAYCVDDWELLRVRVGGGDPPVLEGQAGLSGERK